MKVNNIGRSNYPTKVVEISKNKEKVKKEENVQRKEISNEYIENKRVTYDKPTSKVDQATIQRLREQSDRNFGQLREMVRQLLERQGMTFRDLDGLEIVEVDEETRVKAQEMIGEDGLLSPEKVSDNIVAFARAISGGDKEKIDMLISAIDKGFKEAAKLLGGELPEISKKTYDLVMIKMEAWRE